MAKDSRGLGSSLLAGVLTLCVVIIAAPSHAAVGRTAGSLNVNNVGGATYSIPIFTPPGPKGLQPSVALVYSSNGGKGTLGRGWSLAGFSSIHSCAANETLDGFMGPVRHDGLYCLNGNRLRKQGSGWYGTAGVYLTEMADFSRATLTSGSPPSWEVEGKDGLIYTYGGTTDSRVTPSYWSTTVLEWKLSEIRDRNNNRVRFTYENQHPSTIEWTPEAHNSTDYVNSMEFTYEPDGNAAASTHVESVEGVEVSHDTDLLTAITVKVSGTAKRKYLLDYGSGVSPTTGAKRLETVTECDGAGTDCFAPTTFTYQNGAYGMESTFATSVPYATTDASGEYDFNGDGIKDIAFVVYGQCYVRLGSASGTPYSQEYSIGNAQTVFAGKLKGNTRDQLLALPTSSTTYHSYDWNGSGFTATSTGLTIYDVHGNLTVADLDGDRLADLAYITGWSTDLVGTEYASTPHVYLPHVDLVWRRNTTTGGTVSFGSAVTNSWSWPTEYALPPWFQDYPMEYHYFVNGIGFYAVPSNAYLTRGGDLDGSGEEKLNLTIESSVGDYPLSGNIGDGEELSNGPMNFIVNFQGGYRQSDVLMLNEEGWWVDSKLTSTDFNNDGCDDYAVTSGYIGFSSCSWGGLTNEHTVFRAAGYQSAGPYDGAADMDGDGTPEYMTGVGAKVIRTDGNGDGLDDIGYLVSGSSSTFAITNHASSVVPDLLAQIEDGFGVTHTLEYASIARSNYTAGSSDTFPTRELRHPLHVVSKVTSSDGIGDTYDTTYHYTGAVTSQDRGSFFGFEMIESEDSRSHIKHERQFEMNEPYMGMLKAEKFYQPVGDGGETISSKTMTFATHTLDATSYNQRQFPYVSEITEDVYQVGGASDGDLITRTEIEITTDANTGNVLQVDRTVTDKDANSDLLDDYWTQTTINDFEPDYTHWCLGLPTGTSVAYSTTTGEAGVTRSSAFTNDYTNCRVTAEVVEPGGGDLRVDTTYEYDDFGNVEQVEVTGQQGGSAMAPRATLTDWGATGQFPISVTNALGQETERTFHPVFGSMVTEEDPNDIEVAHNYYDDFGRLTRTVHADGTGTRIAYADCADTSCLSVNPTTGVTGINKLIVTTSERDTSDGVIRDTLTYTDEFDRPILRLTQMLSGDYSAVYSQYDEIGRVSKESVPCDYSSCSIYWTESSYDLLGRVIEQKRPPNDTLSTPLVTTAFAYEGRKQTVTDPEGKVSIKILDVNGWMRVSEDDDQYSQVFSYDAAGSLKEVADSLNPSDPLFQADYSYGIQPFQTATIDKDLGDWTYTYNSLGELIEWEDADSGTDTFSQTYDALSRVLTRDEHEGTTYWTYDVNTNTGCTNGDKGKLVGVSMTNYSEEYCYDDKGRIKKKTITADTDAYDYEYEYNNLGLLDILKYPTSVGSARVKVKYGYQYGHLHYAQDMTFGSAGTVYWTAEAQNARGQITEEKRGIGSGVVVNRNFDAVTGWLNSIETGVGGGTGLQNQSYLYDKVGNVTQRQEGTLGITENFCYDDLYRLIKTELAASPSTPSPICATPDVTIGYDPMGNITHRSDVNNDEDWEYNDPNGKRHAVTSTGTGGATYAYDDNGNMTSRDGETIVWTSYNYPKVLATATESTQLFYGPDRQYYKQQYTGPSGSEETYYIGGLLEKVTKSSVDYWRHYIQVDGQTVAITSVNSNSTGGYKFALDDHLGGTSTLTDWDGTLLVRESFDAFGKPRDGSDWDGAVSSGDLATIEGITRRGYTGHSMLGRMGLIHMNGRVQDADTGRFLSPDPHVAQPGFTQGYNRYAYVNNNPLSFIDPSGFTPAYLCRFRNFAAEAERWFQMHEEAPWLIPADGWNFDENIWRRAQEILKSPIFEDIDCPESQEEADENAKLRKCPNLQVLANGLVPRVSQAANGLGLLLSTELRFSGESMSFGETFRSYQQQVDNYAVGRRGIAGERTITNAKPGQSLHYFNVAFDIKLYASNGRYREAVPGSYLKEDTAAYKHAGELGEQLGLEWGGRFSGRNYDPSHFQITDGLSWEKIRANHSARRDPLCGGTQK